MAATAANGFERVSRSSGKIVATKPAPSPSGIATPSSPSAVSASSAIAAASADANGEGIARKSLMLRHDVHRSKLCNNMAWHREAPWFRGELLFQIADGRCRHHAAAFGRRRRSRVPLRGDRQLPFVLRSPAELEAHMPQIRDRFLSNLEMLRKNMGLPIVTAVMATS
jgi:hypothetical protein